MKKKNLKFAHEKKEFYLLQTARPGRIYNKGGGKGIGIKLEDHQKID